MDPTNSDPGEIGEKYQASIDPNDNTVLILKQRLGEEGTTATTMDSCPHRYYFK